MKPRTAEAMKTRWQGWTLVEKNGSLALDRICREPFMWKWRADAEEIKEEGQRVVRCELRVIK